MLLAGLGRVDWQWLVEDLASRIRTVDVCSPSFECRQKRAACLLSFEGNVKFKEQPTADVFMLFQKASLCVFCCEPCFLDL